MERIVIKGQGINSGWAFDNNTWAYDASKNSWEKLTSGWDPDGNGCAMASYKMAYDRSNRVVVLFGSTGTWLFDVKKRQWRGAKAQGASPKPRIWGHLGYDEKNKKTVLFSGGPYSGPWTDDTWAFDAATESWTEMRPKTSPPARYGGAMAYDSANGVFVLVNGAKGAYLDDLDKPGSKLEDTWVYDLSRNEWREMKPPGQPPHNLIFQAAYDRVNNVTVYPSHDKLYVYRYAKGKP